MVKCCLPFDKNEFIITDSLLYHLFSLAHEGGLECLLSIQIGQSCHQHSCKEQGHNRLKQVNKNTSRGIPVNMKDTGP